MRRLDWPGLQLFYSSTPFPQKGWVTECIEESLDPSLVSRSSRRSSRRRLLEDQARPRRRFTDPAPFSYHFTIAYEDQPYGGTEVIAQDTNQRNNNHYRNKINYSSCYNNPHYQSLPNKNNHNMNKVCSYSYETKMTPVKGKTPRRFAGPAFRLPPIQNVGAKLIVVGQISCVFCLDIS